MYKNLPFTLIFTTLLMAFSVSVLAQNKGVQLGSDLPSFKLMDQDNHLFNSTDLKGKSFLVIYFYPKDDTPGCTKEACSFRDNFDAFNKYNSKIIGISSDSPEDHKAFAQKYNLPYTLLADEDKDVRALFDVPSDLLGLIPGRVTYVFDLNGKCIHIFDSQTSPEKHITEALEVIKKKS